jgi:Protein of unknown function (DUF2442)
MNPRVVAVSPLPDHALLVSFGNGEQRRLDMRPYLNFPVFERLRDSAFFELARADHGTVAWPGGIDLDPDSVYLDSVRTTQSAAA